MSRRLDKFVDRSGRMNAVLKIIQSRRSCRNFKPERVNEKDLEQIIEAGLSAPSGGNFQSCHFTVLYNKDIIDKINFEILKVYEESDHPFLMSLLKGKNRDFFYGAPTVVILSTNTQAITPQSDAAVASQNIMLAAESLGVASCWISLGGALSNPENLKNFGKLLHLPEEHTPFNAVALGYRAEEARGSIKIKEGRVNTVQ